MKRASPEKNCPPAVGVTEGRCTALEAGANPTYGSRPATGKRFSRQPVLTGNNSGARGRGRNGGPPAVNDERAWSWPKRGGEVRMSLNLYKGKRILNLRWWAETREGLIPTKAGVTLPLEAIEDFERAVTAISAAVRSDGP
jgi:hypothetical protein